MEICLKKKPTQRTNIPLLSLGKSEQEDFSYQGEALIVPTVFSGLWSSNNIKKLKIKNIKNDFFELHTP